MTTTLSQADYWELIESADSEPAILCDRSASNALASNALSGDCVYPFPARLGEGSHRSVWLREGLELDIEDYCLRDDVVVTSGDRTHPLEYTFEQIGTAGKSTQQYHLCGSGLAPTETWHRAGGKRIVSVNVHIEPAVFQQWMGDTEVLPAALTPLLRSPDQKYHQQTSLSSAPMRSVFQQILHCPYQGLTRRLYLESKLWEMMALILDDVSSRHDQAPVVRRLNPDDVERIHYAGKILRSRLYDPPSLMELARLAQVNDHKLKVGFRQVFGTTAFGYLHDCRLEKSRQLLESGSIGVGGAAQAVGFVNRSHFAIAFRKKFGMNPSLYRKCSKQTAFRVG
ncbi:MAG: helix-turn-helix transcriptional regulator [Phormidesmis sp. RL_2_1]|nr:helix-turn-helix transcriptional regulator [Phormidesmis sp. RL_2_1]